MNRRIFFRADAGPNIGYGHFIRTLALADMLKDEFECIFVTQTPTEYQQSEVAKVCRLVEVPSTDEKFGLFLEMLDGNEIVVLDNYFFDTDYQRRIKEKGCKLVCIDDMHDKHYVADVVINQGVLDESCFDVELYTKLCLGIKWALVRKPFFNVEFANSREEGHWCVSFGGVDSYNLTYKFAEQLQNFSTVKKITAIIGDKYEGKEYLKKLNKVNIQQNKSAEDIKNVFSCVQGAILSASTITIEALLCGCTVYCGYFVDNQVEYYKNFVRDGLVFPLGNLQRAYFQMSDLFMPNLQHLKNLGICNNYHTLFTSLSFRIVNYTDLNFDESYNIWKIRNMPEIRQYMSNTQAFDFNTHCNYINTLKNDSTKKYWAIFDNNVFVGGYCLTHIYDNIAERGIFLAPEFSGKSIALVIENRMDEVLRKMNITLLKAEVLCNNIRSLKYHKKMGYIIISKDDNYYYLYRQL